MKLYNENKFLKTHFKVLALIVVPPRFISRSLRLKQTNKGGKPCKFEPLCQVKVLPFRLEQDCWFAHSPVVQVPEKLEVLVVDGVCYLLSVTLNQFCVVHHFVLRTHKARMT